MKKSKRKGNRGVRAEKESEVSNLLESQDMIGFSQSHRRMKESLDSAVNEYKRGPKMP